MYTTLLLFYTTSQQTIIFISQMIPNSVFLNSFQIKTQDSGTGLYVFSIMRWSWVCWYQWGRCYNLKCLQRLMLWVLFLTADIIWKGCVSFRNWRISDRGRSIKSVLWRLNLPLFLLCALILICCNIKCFLLSLCHISSLSKFYASKWSWQNMY